MYKILEKTPLNPTVTKMVIEAPLVAKKAEPGQFIIFRASRGRRAGSADRSRIMTVEAGTVTIIFQIVGGATMELERPERRRTALWTLWVRLAHPATAGRA